MNLFSSIHPVMQNVWPADDPALTVAGREVIAGPGFPLGPGMFGVEAQVAVDADVPPDTLLATLRVMSGDVPLLSAPIWARTVQQTFKGMYGGARVNLILDAYHPSLDFHLEDRDNAPYTFRGFKLIPRPGRVWFAADCDRTPAQWESRPDRGGVCITAPASLTTPPVALRPDDYRVGIKFALSDMVPDGVKVLAQIGVRGADGWILPPRDVTREEITARFGIPDSKLRFRLDEINAAVSLTVEALVPGLVVQWIRIADADQSIWQHYYNLGGLTSPLGAPVGGFDLDAATLDYHPAYVRRFTGGRITWTFEHGPCQTHGAIDVYYIAQGGSAGPLGIPITRPVMDDNGATVQTFARGDTVTVLRESGGVVQEANS